MKVLHIAAWYPSFEAPWTAPFIKSHFDSVSSDSSDHKIYNVQILKKRQFPSLAIGQLSSKEYFRVLYLPFYQERVYVYLTMLMLLLLRIELGKQWWTGVHVHIAWPILRFPWFFMKLFGNNVLIGEHWSAYHFNFYLQENSRSHRRLASIFSFSLPVTTVSNALANDILRFAKPHRFPIFVIPNAVDSRIFNPLVCSRISGNPVNQSEGQLNLLMIANWQVLKRPLIVLEACRRLIDRSLKVKIRIIGEGLQRPEMEILATTQQLVGNVTFLGSLRKDKIAEEMCQADALVHPSSYETFSVVCAEALCCGTPVIASNLEAISEYINHSNGMLVNNSIDEWCTALQLFAKNSSNYDRCEISKNALKMFSSSVVGFKLKALYKDLWE